MVVAVGTCQLLSVSERSAYSGVPFRHSLFADTLTFGLVVMVAAGTYQLLSRGLLNTVTARCGAWGGGRGWGLLGTWRAAEAAACYAFSVGDALLGLAVLLAAPWVVYRSGLMRCVQGV